MSTPLRLASVIVFCADVPRLAAFYHDRLGLPLVGEPDPAWTVLLAGSVELGLHRIPDEHLPAPRAEFRVDSNVKLVLELSDDLTAFRARLAAAGVDVDEIRQFPGYPFRTCDGRDPEGNVFQLRQPV